LVEMELAFHLNRGTGRQQCRCIVPKAVHTVKKCSWEWANLSPEIYRADLERLINENLLHLVGCLHSCTGDTRSHKHHICTGKFITKNIGVLPKHPVHVFYIMLNYCPIPCPPTGLPNGNTLCPLRYMK
jgi:hypothetical protein